MELKIGVLLESFRLPAREALDAASRCGARAVQVYATPARLAQSGLDAPAARRDFLSHLSDLGMTVSALCGDLGRGFGDADQNPDLIEQSCAILDLAPAFGTSIITTHIGVVPDDPAHPRYAVMQDACGALAREADKRGVRFAVETGPERAETLRTFLDSLGSKGVSVNLDPANLVMVTGDDPVRAVKTLAPYIVHTHAKDGRRLYELDPEIVYGLKPGDPIVQSPSFLETPLGEGDVPFPAWISALGEIGYRGALTIEREAGNDPERDIARAADFLRNILSSL